MPPGDEKPKGVDTQNDELTTNATYPEAVEPSKAEEVPVLDTSQLNQTPEEKVTGFLTEQQKNELNQQLFNGSHEAGIRMAQIEKENNPTVKRGKLPQPVLTNEQVTQKQAAIDANLAKTTDITRQAKKLPKQNKIDEKKLFESISIKSDDNSSISDKSKQVLKPESVTSTKTSTETPEQRFLRLEQDKQTIAQISVKKIQNLKEAGKDVNSLTQKFYPESQKEKGFTLGEDSTERGLVTNTQKPVGFDKNNIIDGSFKETPDNKTNKQETKDIDERFKTRIKSEDRIREELRQTQEKLVEIGEKVSEIGDIKNVLRAIDLSFDDIYLELEKLSDREPNPTEQVEPVVRTPTTLTPELQAQFDAMQQQLDTMQHTLENERNAREASEAKIESDKQNRSRRLKALLIGVAVGVAAVVALPAVTVAALGAYASLGAVGTGFIAKSIGKKREESLAELTRVKGLLTQSTGDVNNYLRDQIKELEEEQKKKEKWWKFFDSSAHFLCGFGVTAMVGGVVKEAIQNTAINAAQANIGNPARPPAPPETITQGIQPGISEVQNIATSNIPDISGMKTIDMNQFGWKLAENANDFFVTDLGGKSGVAHRQLLEFLRNSGKSLSATSKEGFFTAINNMVTSNMSAAQAAAQFLP